MNLYFLFMTLLLIKIILFIFFLVSKSEKWDNLSSSTFECGFSSYFFSRFSFSVHYFMIALIFLFLDLELCFIMPFFKEYMSNFISIISLYLIVIFLLMGLILEWTQGKLEWIF